MRHRVATAGVLIAALAGWAGAPVSEAGLLSKSYEFRTGVILEVGVTSADGLRLDTVRFKLPAPSRGRHRRSGGLVRAEVTISNTADAPRRVGLAMALFDDGGRLLGVANGGNKLTSLKPGRQNRFELVFDGVNAEAHGTTVFQISLESK